MKTRNRRYPRSSEMDGDKSGESRAFLFSRRVTDFHYGLRSFPTNENSNFYRRGRRQWISLITNNPLYYMEESVLLGTKPLVDSIRHFIRDPSGVFSVCHLCECRIVQWRHDSRLLLLLNWFLHIIKRTLHVGSKIWILCSRGKNIKFISSRHRVISSIYARWRMN